MKIRIPADEGMRIVTRMVKAKYVEKVSCVNRCIISKGQSHKLNNGKPFFFLDAHIEKLNMAINKIADELDKVEIRQGDVKAQLLIIRSIVCLRYVFQEEMGKSKSWQDHRLSKAYTKKKKDGTTHTMLNHFTNQDVKQINMAIKKIAEQLKSIQLTDEYEGEIKPCNNDKKVYRIIKGN